MKTSITSFLVAVMLLVSGSMKAQFSEKLVDEPRTGWCEGSDVTFKLSEVAAQMQVTVTQLVDAFDEWTANANGDSNGYEFNGFFMLENSNTTPTFHSEQYGGFEMDLDGNFSSWNSGAYWGVYIHFMDVETDELAMTICQNPTNPLKADQECHGTVSINLNGGQATFELTFSVEAGESIDKEAVTDLSKLTIVGETSVECVQEQNDQWWNYEYTIPTAGIADKLDIDAAYMTKMFRQMVFAKDYDSTNEQWGKLSNEGAATPAPGFYFSGGIIHVDPETEEEYEDRECRNASYGDGNLFWVSNVQYLQDEDAVYCYVGQYPNGMQAGESRTADIYIVYGDKAYVIHYTVSLPSQTPITDLTKVGEDTWTIAARDPQLTWNSLEYHALNLDSIAALFTAKAGKEVTPSDFKLMATNSYGGITDAYTADSTETTQGFWMADGGVVGNYSDGSTSFYIDYIHSDSQKALALGNKPSAFDGGETVTGAVYLVVGDSLYYAVNVNMTIITPKYTINDCNITEYNMTVKVVPSSSSWSIGTTSVTNLEEMIGMANGKFYGVTSEGTITDSYSVSEVSQYGGGGFWMSAADPITGMAYAANYTGDGAYAVWYYDSEITWFNIPGARQAGEEFYGTFYIANLWDGEAVKINLTLKFVESIVTIKPVGTEELYLNARNTAGDDFDEASLDLSKACEQLVCTEDELLESGVWMVETADGDLSSDNFDEMYGFSFNADGEAVAAEDAVFQVGFADGNIHSFVVDDANVENPYKTTLYIQYNNKLYAFNITINVAATGINAVETETDNATVYDLAGRKVANPTKGIYIKGGKKFLVK